MCYILYGWMTTWVLSTRFTLYASKAMSVILVLGIYTVASFVHLRGENPKIPGIVKKNIKIFAQVWKFSPLRSTPPATGYNNPSNLNNHNAGNIV